MVGVYPKKNKSDIVYYVKQLNYRFTMPKLDASGAKMRATNQNTGLPLSLPNGDPVYIEDPIAFIPWKIRFSEEGYCSVYVVTKETDPRIAAELKKDAADRACKIMDEKQYIKSTNPDLAERITSDESTAAAIAEKDAALNEQAAEIARLKDRLNGRKN